MAHNKSYTDIILLVILCSANKKPMIITAERLDFLLHSYMLFLSIFIAW